MLSIEGERWLVSLGGFFGERMPQNHPEFLAYAQSLPVPDLYDVIRRSEPVSEVVHYRFAGSLRRHYERLKRFPEGLIVLGDAVCSFNPIYGQGMTVSAIEAELLDNSLLRAKANGGIDPDFARRWFKSIQPAINAAWVGGSLRTTAFPNSRASVHRVSEHCSGILSACTRRHTGTAM